MKRIIKMTMLVAGILFFATTGANAQKNESNNKNSEKMKTFVIEREVPGVSKLSAAELKGLSQTSCGVLKEMGPKIEWLHSYVAGDKIYCIYKAENADLIREHAKKGGFPANKITELATIISPATAE